MMHPCGHYSTRQQRSYSHAHHDIRLICICTALKEMFPFLHYISEWRDPMEMRNCSFPSLMMMQSSCWWQGGALSNMQQQANQKGETTEIFGEKTGRARLGTSVLRRKMNEKADRYVYDMICQSETKNNMIVVQDEHFCLVFSTEDAHMHFIFLSFPNEVFHTTLFTLLPLLRSWLSWPLDAYMMLVVRI